MALSWSEWKTEIREIWVEAIKWWTGAKARHLLKHLRISLVALNSLPLILRVLHALRVDNSALGWITIRSYRSVNDLTIRKGRHRLLHGIRATIIPRSRLSIHIYLIIKLSSLLLLLCIYSHLVLNHKTLRMFFFIRNLFSDIITGWAKNFTVLVKPHLFEFFFTHEAPKASGFEGVGIGVVLAQGFEWFWYWFGVFCLYFFFVFINLKKVSLIFGEVSWTVFLLIFPIIFNFNLHFFVISLTIVSLVIGLEESVCLTLSLGFGCSCWLIVGFNIHCCDFWSVFVNFCYFLIWLSELHLDFIITELFLEVS